MPMLVGGTSWHSPPALGPLTIALVCGIMNANGHQLGSG